MLHCYFQSSLVCPSDENDNYTHLYITILDAVYYVTLNKNLAKISSKLVSSIKSSTS